MLPVMQTGHADRGLMRDAHVLHGMKQHPSSLFLHAASPTTTLSRSTRSTPRIGFVFTGQGAQWASMGIELMQHPVFRNSMEAADHYLQHELDCGWSAIEELGRDKRTSQLNAALYSQTLCTVLQVALVELLKEWSITPAAIVGHSSGEIAAAYCLGALSREDAWKTAYFRGLLSSKLKEDGTKGAMLAVGASSEYATRLIGQIAPGKVYVACVNSPQCVTLSGDADAVSVIHGELHTRRIFVQRLQVDDMAYHSPHMQKLALDYFEAISTISTKSHHQTECNMYSSVTGDVIEPSELGASSYWVRNLMLPVQFETAIQRLMRPDAASQDKGLDMLVEIGPHAALRGPALQSLQAIGVDNMPYHSVLVRGKDAVQTALNLAGLLGINAHSTSSPPIISLLHNTTTTKSLADLPAYPQDPSLNFWAESRSRLKGTSNSYLAV